MRDISISYSHCIKKVNIWYLPIESIHITVNIPGCGWGQIQVRAEQLRHLTQREAIQAVQTILGGLLLAKPDKHVSFLLAKCSANRHHLAKLGEVSANFFLRNFAILVEEGKAVVTKYVHFNIPVKLNQSVFAGFYNTSGSSWRWRYPGCHHVGGWSWHVVVALPQGGWRHVVVVSWHWWGTRVTSRRATWGLSTCWSVAHQFLF